jgi:hypothetical protein
MKRQVKKERTAVNDTRDKHKVANISENFHKNFNGHNRILRGPGETDS